MVQILEGSAFTAAQRCPCKLSGPDYLNDSAESFPLSRTRAHTHTNARARANTQTCKNGMTLNRMMRI